MPGSSRLSDSQIRVLRNAVSEGGRLRYGRIYDERTLGALRRKGFLTEDNRVTERGTAALKNSDAARRIR